MMIAIWCLCVEFLAFMRANSGVYAWNFWRLCVEFLAFMRTNSGVYAWNFWRLCVLQYLIFTYDPCHS
ncbi:hypothetical protein CSP26_22855 [Salmonella enterica subsp. indica]|nr:hypothetical protein [Salmonella enterica subsp. indica]